MASFNALWRYVESGDVRLQACSCKVTFRVAGDICVVDSSTARLLELRQSGVEALLEDRLLDRVQQLLPGVGDLDLLLARLSAEPRQRGIQWYKETLTVRVTQGNL
eukprot:g13111.t1